MNTMGNILLKLLSFVVGSVFGDAAPKKQKSWKTLSIPGLDIGHIFKESKVGNLLNESVKNWTHMRARFISAGTGAGKSTFENYVIQIARAVETPKRVLTLVNRTALKRASIVKMAKRLRLTSELEDQIKKNKGEIPETIYLGHITIMTYQAMVRKIFETGFINDPDHGYAYVCFDEAHFFISDSSFNELTGKALNILMNVFHNAVRIYLTATEAEVLPHIVYEEKKLLQKKLDSFDKAAFMATINTQRLNDWLNQKYPSAGYTVYNCKEIAVQHDGGRVSHFYEYLAECEPKKLELWPEGYYDENVISIDLDPKSGNKKLPKKNAVEYIRFERDFSSYELHIGTVDAVSEGNGEDLIAKFAAAAKKLLQVIPENDKVMIFAEEESLCQKIAEETKGFRKVVAISRDLIRKGGEAAKEYANIIANEMFEANTICTTKVLDNGVNINDTGVKYIIILMTDLIDILQCLGRVRLYGYATGEKVHVIYLIPPKEWIRIRIDNFLAEGKRLVNEYLQVIGTVGGKMLTTLPENSFLTVNVEYVPEEVAKQIEALSLLGVSYGQINEAMQTEGVKRTVTLDFNNYRIQNIKNKLFVYEQLTDLKLTGDFFCVDPELPLPENIYDRYYEMISDLIPASKIEPVEIMIEEQGYRLLTEEENRKQNMKEADEKLQNLLNTVKETFLSELLTEKTGERKYGILDTVYEQKRKEVYKAGKELPILMEIYPELKALNVNGQSTGQKELSALLNKTVMQEHEELKIGNNSDGKRIVTVTSK